MKNVTKIGSVVLAAALSMSLVACGAASSSTVASSSEAASSEATNNVVEEGVKTGFGVVTTTSGGEGKGQVDSVGVAVLISEDGVILDAKLDVAQNKFAVEEGALVMAESYQSKKERGADYGMVGASGIGKEWFEQAEAFEAYLIGKEAATVAQLPLDDADLLAGCTISAVDFAAAAAKAVANASVLGANEGDILALAFSSENAYGNKDASADADGSATIETSFVAVTKDADGKVTSAIFDKNQPKFTVSADSVVTAPEAVPSKLELGADYGMVGASGIGKEWFEQSEAFCAYLVGKTADEIAGIAVSETGAPADADLAAGCTISMGSAIATAAKAAQ